MELADRYANLISSTVDTQFYSGYVVPTLGRFTLDIVRADATRTAVERVQDAMDCLWSYKTALELAAEHGGSLDSLEADASEAEPHPWEISAPTLARDVEGAKKRFVSATKAVPLSANLYDNTDFTNREQTIQQSMQSLRIEANPNDPSSSNLKSKIALPGKQLQAKDPNPQAGYVAWLDQPDSFETTKGIQPSSRL